MRFSSRAAALIASMALLSLPAIALAGTSKPPKPVANGNYCINCTSSKSDGTIHVSTDGRSIDGFSYYNDCAAVPALNPPTIDIRKDGSFSWTGKLKDVVGKKHWYELKGHFVTPHTIRGVIKATGGGKSCSAVPYKAKFTDKGPFEA